MNKPILVVDPEEGFNGVPSFPGGWVGKSTGFELDGDGRQTFAPAAGEDLSGEVVEMDDEGTEEETQENGKDGEGGEGGEGGEHTFWDFELLI